MTDPDAPRTVADSRVRMTEIVLPEDSNARGSIFGGRVLALIDKCAAIVAMRHSRTEVVTASMDSVVFVNKVLVGHVLLLTGQLNAAFESSMEVQVRVQSENPLTGERLLTTCARVTMVAVDERGRPRKAPPLVLTTDGERQAAEAAGRRRRSRLAARQRDASRCD